MPQGRGIYFKVEVDDQGTVKLKKFGGSVKDLGKEVDTASDKTSRFNSRFRKMGQSLKDGIIAMAKSKLTVAGLGIALVGTLKAYADFDRQLGMVATMLDQKSMPLLDQYKSGLRGLAIDAGESTATLSKGLYDILSASIAPSKAMDVLTVATKAAGAGFTDTAVAADAITTILNSYKMSADEAGSVSDLLFSIIKRGKTTFAELAPTIGYVSSLAAESGLTLEELGATIATLTRAGIRTEIAMTGVRAILSTIVSPANESQKAFKTLTERIYGQAQALDTAFLKQKGMIGILELLQHATTEETAAIFGNVRALTALMPALGNTAGYLKDIRIMMDRAGATQEAYEKATANLVFQFNQLKQAIVVTSGAIGEEFAPEVKAAIRLVLQLRDKVNDLRISVRAVQFDFTDTSDTIKAFNDLLASSESEAVRLERELMDVEEALKALEEPSWWTKFMYELKAGPRAFWKMGEDIEALKKRWLELKTAVGEAPLTIDDKAIIRASMTLGWYLDLLGEVREETKKPFEFTEITAKEFDKIRSATLKRIKESVDARKKAEEEAKEAILKKVEETVNERNRIEEAARDEMLAVHEEYLKSIMSDEEYLTHQFEKEFEDRVKKFQEALDAQRISKEDFDQAVLEAEIAKNAAIAEGFENLKDDADDATTFVTAVTEQMAYSMQRTMSDFFFDFMDNKITSMRDLWLSALDVMKRAVADLAASWLFTGQFGGGGQPFGGFAKILGGFGLSGLLGGIGGLFGGGGTTAGTGAGYLPWLQPELPLIYKGMQHGGVATKPTLAMVAEKEPEAVIPLSKLAKSTSSLMEERESKIASSVEETVIKRFEEILKSEDMVERLKRLETDQSLKKEIIERDLFETKHIGQQMLDRMGTVTIPVNYEYGGIAYKPTLASVAEKEPELIMPLSKLWKLGTPMIPWKEFLKMGSAATSFPELSEAWKMGAPAIPATEFPEMAPPAILPPSVSTRATLPMPEGASTSTVKVSLTLNIPRTASMADERFAQRLRNDFKELLDKEGPRIVDRRLKEVS